MDARLGTLANPTNGFWQAMNWAISKLTVVTRGSATKPDKRNKKNIWTLMTSWYSYGELWTRVQVLLCTPTQWMLVRHQQPLLFFCLKLSVNKNFVPYGVKFFSNIFKVWVAPSNHCIPHTKNSQRRRPCCWRDVAMCVTPRSQPND